jgi:TPR repeat protein
MKSFKMFLIIIVIITLVFYLASQSLLHDASVSSNGEIDTSIVLAPKDTNDSLGYYALAMEYHEGKKIERDYGKAMENYKRSCELKYGLACLSIAYMYANSEGVEQSREKASEYFAKACDYGYVGGCKNWNSMNGYAPCTLPILNLP